MEEDRLRNVFEVEEFRHLTYFGFQKDFDESKISGPLEEADERKIKRKSIARNKTFNC